MKIQLFALLVACGVMATVQVVEAKHGKLVKQCYCAVKCGPRDVGSVKGDSPRYETIGDQTICFCQQRDVDLYRQGNCGRDDSATQIAKSACRR